MKCTIQDIASELHMSRNTIAKALSGKPGVSDATRKLIQKKAREMNYKNSILELESEDLLMHNGSILFLTRASSNYSEFWTSVLKGIESVLRPNNYDLVLSIMNDNDLDSLDFTTNMSNSNIKGIILVEINYKQVIDYLCELKIPLVTVDMPRDYEHLIGKLDIITMENKINIKKIVYELVQKGAKRFAYAGDIHSDNGGRGFKERYDALYEILQSFNLQIEEKTSLCYQTEDDFMDSSYLINKIEKMESLPDVFVCGNDWTGIQIMHALQFLGYRIPKDVSIVGFDNIPESSKVHPSLTTIDTPKEQLGIAAAKCIIERIEKPDIPFVYSQYATTLIQRDSTI